VAGGPERGGTFEREATARAGDPAA
jgi:hypothetical protein